MSETSTLKLYDTLTRSLRSLHPEDGQSLRFYCCGPTVYGPAHIGNFRTFISQDIFRRVLELARTKTYHVRNITDVDDKTIRDSQKAGQTLIEFTQYWTKKFHADCQALNLLSPHVEPKATDHIPHQIRMIETLIERGHAYVAADGSVYFKVNSYADYGKLSHLEDRELKLGTAQTANDRDEYSKDSLADFALWKAFKEEDGENFWDSPWGKGRPGWHLECSAMSLEYLGESFDLHGGGVDLIFPHHENEIAQSCCSTRGHFARHWMHAAHLMVDGGKMSKSLGNLYTLEDLKAKGYTAAEVRYTLISGNYRQPLNFTIHSLDAAKQALQKLAKFAQSLLKQTGSPAISTHDDLRTQGQAHGFESAWQCLLEDLNVPGALGQIFATLNKTKVAQLSAEEALQLSEGLNFVLDALGLQLPVLEEAPLSEAPAEVLALATQRWEAKISKNWAEADRLRGEVEAAGWIIKDKKEGFDLLPKA